MRLDLPVIRVTPPAAGSAGSIQNGLRRIRMRPASDDADGFDLRVETGGAFLLEAAQPPVHGLAGHPGCFRRLGRGPTHMDSVHQQPASERCQPASTTLPHEGLLESRMLFTHDSTRQALTDQAPPIGAESGFIRG